MSSNDMSIPFIQIILNSPVFSLILLLILIGKKLSLFQNLNNASLNPKDTPIQLIFLLKIFKEISVLPEHNILYLSGMNSKIVNQMSNLSKIIIKKIF
ncbi:hypothetical protein A0H76_758 [Hepatospora eriocheir]|uniref:Uncharacterized protein n=1 Tax=Hepatospora eriocheir TaxID=1081669 RepID=A0A1X0QI96_9MICR|nr:hypothetical protein A0H76_758 [Hepatospora eriocheir]